MTAVTRAVGLARRPGTSGVEWRQLATEPVQSLATTRDGPLPTRHLTESTTITANLAAAVVFAVTLAVILTAVIIIVAVEQTAAAFVEAVAVMRTMITVAAT